LKTLVTPYTSSTPMAIMAYTEPPVIPQIKIFKIQSYCRADILYIIKKILTKAMHQLS